MKVFLGILIPLLGTSIGSFLVFFMKNKINNKKEVILLGFASGVMIAASIWSLIIPSIEITEKINGIKWLPASIGFIFGIILLIIIKNKLIKIDNKKIKDDKLRKIIIMIFTIIMHNIPEGLAVGVCFASALKENSDITIISAIIFAIGIGIQNIPEGAIISMPLKTQGLSKTKSFVCGVLSGIVEPIFSLITLVIVNSIEIVLPYCLSFAAGAMFYVVIEELIQKKKKKKNNYIGIISFSVGFIMMMIMDVALV